MAEGLLGGVLGSEDEKPETEAPQALASAEAFAAAVAAKLSASDSEVAHDTSAFLKEQTRLLETQRRHLDDEHALRLAHLAHQSHLLIGQRLGQVIRLAFQIVIALVVIVIGIGIAVMLHDAFISHSVVIDSFNAPAGLASRGVTGTVVASGVLNELTRLQQATRSSDLIQQKRSVSNGWSNEVRVDVPETGVSLGEISQLLRARFGHDLHIGGGLVESASGGLALTVSGDNLGSKTFTGGSDDLDKLVANAAQYVYSQFQPALWVHYLVDTDRCPEAVSVIQSTYDVADDQSRASLLTDWGGCLPIDDTDYATGWRARLAMHQEAVALDPQFWWAYAQEENDLVILGEDEEAWRVGQAARRAAGSQLSRLVARGEPALFLSDLFLTHDLQAARKELIADAAANGGIGSIAGGSNGPFIAVAEAELHDRTAAEVTLQTLAGRTAPGGTGAIHLLRAAADDALGETVQAETEWQAIGPVEFRGLYAMLACPHAQIEEAAGHPDKADAILALSNAEHHVDCQRFRGDILDHRGNWAGAQQAYAQAVALAPDLPAGYYSWGLALARHGDLAGAIAKLQAANQRGPHWADPLKAWGDVLAKRGHWSDAVAKYDEALNYAPNWAALKQARDAAARKSS
jgi:tetratricopeptide (TPR) repeat protein